MKKLAHNQRGSVLVMTIIIMSGILIVSIEFAVFVISNVRQARNLDHAQQAYYAAETGAESGLYQLRKQNPGATSLVRNTGAVASSTWDITGPRFATNLDVYEKDTLPKNQSIEMSLYSGNGLLGINAQSMKVSWETSTCTAGDPTPWIETSIVSWTGGPSIDWSSETVAKNVKTIANPGDKEVIFNNVALPTPMAVRVKALYCNLTGVKVSFFNAPNATGTIIPIPNIATLRPLGSESNVQQSVRVTFPLKTPTSGLYDYVIFSEDKVSK